MAASLLWKVVLGILLSVGPACAVTMDELEVVMRGPQPGSAVVDSDLFGYSAALHNMMDVDDASAFNDVISNARVLIGVPKGTVPGATVQSTGYVLQCPLMPGNCTPITETPTGNDGRLYDTSGNDDNEEKSGQLLGATMESRNGQFVVCGHKWVYREGSSSFIQGLCLLSQRQLSGFTLLRPCTPVGSFNDFIDRFNFWDYCSTGSSVSFLPSSELILGSPGTGSWGGSNFGYALDPVVPTTDVLSTSFSLAGFSVASVRVTSPTAQEWVTGAPRAMEYLGQVYVVNYQVSGDAARPLIQNPLIAITGTKFGSYYGHTVAGVDFNGDGYDDVLVGAPLYFQSASVPEEGAVYIYRNQVVQNTGSLDSTVFTLLTAPGGGVAYSRFGHAIAPLGDLDEDGFEDVAISAPFGNGLSGTVYIYRGSLQGIVTTPAQTLTPDDLNLMPSLVTGLTSFGAHLSGTTDIDGNQHNDLVIGSFASSRVFVVRSRTVAIVTTSVTPSTTSVIIRGIANCSFDMSENNCLEVEFCWSVRGQGLRTNQNIDIAYTLYADLRQSGLTPRATFSNGMSEISGTQVLTVGGGQTCNTTLLYVTGGTPFELQSDPLRPTMTVNIPQGTVPSANDGNMDPIDLTQNRLFQRLEGALSALVIGSDECDVSGCIADVSVRNSSVQYISRSDPAFSEEIILVGVVTDVVFRTTIENAGPNTAYNLELVFTHPTVLAYSRVEDGAQFTCETDQTRTVTTCTVTNALAANDQTQVGVRFVILSSNVGGNVNALNVVATAATSSDDMNQGNNMEPFVLPLQATVSPAVTGQISADQLPILTNFSRDDMPTSVADIGREVKVNFTVTNNGPSAIGQGRLTIYLPYRSPCTTMNRFLFYVASVSVANLQNGVCTASPMNGINVLQLMLPASTEQTGDGENGTDTSDTGTGARPMLDDVPGTCTPEDATTRTIRCAEGDQGCVVLTCVVNSQQSGYRGQLSITGYIDDDYYKETDIHHLLYFNAQYEVLDNNSFSEVNTQDNAAEVSLFLRNPNVVQPAPVPQPVQAWVIIVPIVLALLAIGIAFVALWACGFFKRKRRKQQQEQQEQDQQPLPQQQEGETGENGQEKVDLSGGDGATGQT